MRYKGYKILTHRIGKTWTYSLDGVKPMQTECNRFDTEEKALDGAKKLADYFETLI